MVKENKNNRGRKPKVRDYNSVFAQRFRKLIEDAKITLPELAQHIGTTRQSIGQWKDGNTIPDISALKRIAEYFNVTSDYLLGLSDVASIDTDVQAVCEYTGLTESTVQEMHSCVTAEQGVDVFGKHYSFPNHIGQFIDVLYMFQDKRLQIGIEFMNYIYSVKLCKYMTLKFPYEWLKSDMGDLGLGLSENYNEYSKEKSDTHNSLLKEYNRQQKDVQPLALYKIQKYINEFITTYAEAEANNITAPDKFIENVPAELKDFFDNAYTILKEGDT